MKQDRFDEFYMLQTQAKDLEKRNKKAEALKIYLDILNNYFPDTDFSFKRTIELLKSFNRDDEIMPYVDLAIERIKNNGMKGDITFFEALKLQFKEKKQTKCDSNLMKSLSNIHVGEISFWAIYVIVAISLSLPLKIYKFAFIILLSIVIRLVIEIFRRIKINYSVSAQVIALLISMILGAFSAAQIPPPEWTEFFTLAPLANVSKRNLSEPITKTNATILNQTPTDNSLVTEDDLTTLTTVHQDNLILESYTLDINDKKIKLTLYIKDSVTDAEIKSAADGILSELNTIKEHKTYDDRLGDLYKTYTATVVAYEKNQKLRLKGQTNKYTLKIKWQ